MERVLDVLKVNSKNIIDQISLSINCNLYYLMIYFFAGYANEIDLRLNI
jgi:hypothetical protein